MPSPLKLRDATALTVDGDWTFGKHVSVVGDVTLGAEGGHVGDGSVLR
jgi:UTP--glucose-1-phosphate uridylyltransferase